MENIQLISEKFISVIQTTKNLAAKTIIAYTSDLNDFCRYIQLNELERDVVLKYTQYLMQERKLRISSINRKLVILKMFFDYLTAKGIIPENYYKAHPMKLRKEKILPKTLALYEVNQLLKCAIQQQHQAKTMYDIWKTSRNLALIDVLISTGIRIAEAAAISIKDINFSDQVILINGKGKKQRLIYISCSQTWDHLTEWLVVR